MKNPFKWAMDKLSRKKKKDESLPDPANADAGQEQEQHKVEMSDPTALPSGTMAEANAAKARMDKAVTEHRWVEVSSGTYVEYSEEWQEIIRMCINGLGSMLRMSNLFGPNMSTNTDKDSPVKTEYNPDGTPRYVAVSNAGILAGTIDTQQLRLKCVIDLLETFPPLPLEHEGKTYTVDDKFLAMLRDCEQRLLFGLEGDIESMAVGVKQDLITAMENCGFVFETRRERIVGDKYYFTRELRFVGAEPKKEKAE